MVNGVTICQCDPHSRIVFSALVHGDPHFSTIDGQSFTFNGFGEYVCLRSKVEAPVFIMVQCRTQFVPGFDDNPNDLILPEPEATYIR